MLDSQLYKEVHFFSPLFLIGMNTPICMSFFSDMMTDIGW